MDSGNFFVRGSIGLSQLSNSDGKYKEWRTRCIVVNVSQDAVVYVVSDNILSSGGYTDAQKKIIANQIAPAPGGYWCGFPIDGENTYINDVRSKDDNGNETVISADTSKVYVYLRVNVVSGRALVVFSLTERNLIDWDVDDSGKETGIRYLWLGLSEMSAPDAQGVREITGEIPTEANKQLQSDLLASNWRQNEDGNFVSLASGTSKSFIGKQLVEPVKLTPENAESPMLPARRPAQKARAAEPVADDVEEQQIELFATSPIMTEVNRTQVVTNNAIVRSIAVLDDVLSKARGNRQRIFLSEEARLYSVQTQTIQAPDGAVYDECKLTFEGHYFGKSSKLFKKGDILFADKSDIRDDLEETEAGTIVNKHYREDGRRLQYWMVIENDEEVDEEGRVVYTVIYKKEFRGEILNPGMIAVRRGNVNEGPRQSTVCINGEQQRVELHEGRGVRGNSVWDEEDNYDDSDDVSASFGFMPPHIHKDSGKGRFGIYARKLVYDTEFGPEPYVMAEHDDFGDVLRPELQRTGLIENDGDAMLPPSDEYIGMLYTIYTSPTLTDGEPCKVLCQIGECFYSPGVPYLSGATAIEFSGIVRLRSIGRKMWLIDSISGEFCGIVDSDAPDAPGGEDPEEPTPDAVDFIANCTQQVAFEGSTYYRDPRVISLSPGDTLHVDCTSEIGIIVIHEISDNVYYKLAQADYHQPLAYTATGGIDVYVATYNQQQSPCHVYVTKA